MIAKLMTRLVSWGLRALGTVLNRAGHLVRRTGGRPGTTGRPTQPESSDGSGPPKR